MPRKDRYLHNHWGQDKLCQHLRAFCDHPAIPLAGADNGRLVRSWSAGGCALRGACPDRLLPARLRHLHPGALEKESDCAVWSPATRKCGAALRLGCLLHACKLPALAAPIRSKTRLAPAVSTA